MNRNHATPCLLLAILFALMAIPASGHADPPAPGERFQDELSGNDVGPEMVVIPAGRFEMGSPEGEAGRWVDETPRHEVRIPGPFAVSRDPITVAEFAAFVEASDYETEGERNPQQGCRILDREWQWGEGHSWREPGIEQEGAHPVVCVTREDVRAYLDWLSAESGAEYRLPSEAEWEYLARAGTDTARWWGEEIEADRANCMDCPNDWRGQGTSPVDAFPANKFGVRDSLGNVFEWTEDCWNGSHADAPGDGSARTDGDCDHRVTRGGAWLTGEQQVHAAYRDRQAVDYRGYMLGFRVVRELD